MNLEESRKVTEELKTATREARECLKDFKALNREYRELSEDWAEKAGRLMTESAEEAMKNYFNIVEKAIKEATQAVYNRFDTLANIMMGEDGKGEPLSELLKKKNERDIFKRKMLKDDLL